MKILMVTPYLPYPPNSGGQIRTLNLLKYLSKKHQITLIALYKKEKEKKFLKKLKKYAQKVYLCKRASSPWKLPLILKTFFSPYPFLIIRNFSSQAASLINQLIKKNHYDIIHMETFYTMPHLPLTKIPILLVEQTIEFKVYLHFIKRLPLPLRTILYLDVLKLRYWEKQFWKKATVVAAVSRDDQMMINQTETNLKTTVVKNGAGDEMFSSILKKADLNHPRLLFVGNFSWLQNTEAAKLLINQYFPFIKKLLPKAKLTIAGQEANKKLKGKFPVGIKIINLTNNFDRLKALYQEATLFVSPILGPGGTRLKLLAAMASGLPILSSSNGVKGLDLVNNVNVLIANSPQEFAKKAVSIHKDKFLYNKIQKNSYQLVKKKYNWKVITKKLETVYKNMVSNKNR